jgi:hypothetical protein
MFATKRLVPARPVDRRVRTIAPRDLITADVHGY